MGAQHRYAVQTFVQDGKGGLQQGRLIDCRGAEEAQRMADERVRFGYAVGAAAFLRSNCDGEFGDASEPITLAVFGTVPAGVEETIPF